MRTRAISFIFFVLLSILFLHPVNSGDFFHHIATGQDIIIRHALPYTDSWTFTAHGKPWVAHSWGSGVLYYLIYTAWSYTGISVLFAVIGTLTAYFTFLTLRRLTIPWITRLIIVGATAAIVSLRWPSRPEVFGPFFVSILLYLIPSVSQPKRAFVIPLLMWIWSIMYGSSAFLGILLITTYLLVTRSLSKRTLLILLLSLLAANANGYGLQSFLYIFRIPAIAGNVGEWLPVTEALNPHNPGVVLFYQYPVVIYSLYTLVTVSLIVWGIRKGIRPKLFYVVLAAGLVLPFVSVRFINLTPLLAAPILGLTMDRVTPKARRVSLIAICALGIFATLVRLATYPIGVGLEPIPFASSSISYLAAHHVRGNIYASQELGGYIHWRLPQASIWYDTRDDLYQYTTVVQDMHRLYNGQTDLLSLLLSYKVDVVVGDIDNAIYTPLFYLNTWKLVHIGDSSFVAVRTEIAKRYGLNSYDSLDPTRVPPVKPGLLTEAREEMTRVIRMDASVENQVRLAEILLANGDTTEAIRIIDTLKTTGFLGMGAPIVNLGLSEIQAKFYLTVPRCAEAKTALLAAQRYSTHPFLFSPQHNLLSAAALYWGKYYTVCERDIPRARAYYLDYAAQTTSARERRNIEILLDTLR